MSGAALVLVVLVVLVIALAMFGVGIFNRLVTLKNRYQGEQENSTSCGRVRCGMTPGTRRPYSRGCAQPLFQALER